MIARLRLRFRRRPSAEDVTERYAAPVVIPPRPGVLLGPHPFTQAIAGLRAWGEGRRKAIAK